MKLIKIMNNAHVLIKDNTKYLFSYETCIAQWGGGVLFIVKDWDNYSTSTNIHLYRFIRDYTCYDVYNKKDVIQLIKNPKETNVILVERL